jgi:hypothetical protein
MHPLDSDRWRLPIMVPSVSSATGTCVPGGAGVEEDDFHQSVNEKPIAFQAKEKDPLCSKR